MVSKAGRDISRSPSLLCVMDTDNRCSVEDRDCIRCDGPLDSLFLRQVEDCPKEGFPGQPDKKRSPESGELGEVPENREVVFEIFAETDSRVNDDSVFSDPGCDGGVDPLGQERVNLTENVSIGWAVLHRCWITLHVHQNNERVGACCDTGHSLIEAQRTDIVDDPGAVVKRFFGDLRFGRVDRDGNSTSLADSFDDGDHAICLGLGGDRLRTRARRFTAHINDIRTLVDHPKSVFDGVFVPEETVAIVERVRCHVYDSHDQDAISMSHPFIELNHRPQYTIGLLPRQRPGLTKRCGLSTITRY